MSLLTTMTFIFYLLLTFIIWKFSFSFKKFCPYNFINKISSHYYKMWVQFTSLCSLDQWIHWFFYWSCWLWQWIHSILYINSLGLSVCLSEPVHSDPLSVSVRPILQPPDDRNEVPKWAAPGLKCSSTT